MRVARPLFLVMFAVLVVACGGGTPASADGNTNQSEDAAASTAASAAASTAASAAASQGGGAPGDIDGMIDALTPPNSTETNRTVASGGGFVSWESTDSVDSLKGFYESAIPATGMQIFSTTNASGTTSWLFAESEGSSRGGSVTIAPSSSGGSGASVVVTVAME